MPCHKAKIRTQGRANMASNSQQQKDRESGKNKSEKSCSGNTHLDQRELSVVSVPMEVRRQS